MNKILDYINDHRWIKFLSLLFGFSPIAKWISENAETSKQVSMAHSFDYFGLITAIITTLLLWLAFATSWSAKSETKKAKEQLEISQELLQSYKTVGALSHRYVRFKLYTGAGLTATYFDENLLNQTEQARLKEEIKWVYSTLQKSNPNLPADTIHQLMADFYGMDKKDLLQSYLL